MAKKKPVVDYGRCMACRVCETACPWSCIEMRKIGIDVYRKVYPELAREDACTGCGLCAVACPIGVIEMADR